MKSRNLKISFYLYNFTLFCFFIIAFVYMSRSEFMSYHAEAVNMEWNQVPDNFKILILAGIRTIGALMFTISIAIVTLLYIPFKKEILWAKYALGALNVLVTISLIYVVLFVRSNTNAHPPLYPLLVILCIVIVSFIFSIKREDNRLNK